MAHPRGAASCRVEVAELADRGGVDAALARSWDAWLTAAGSQAGFTQTSCWARISATINGARSLLVTLRDDDGALRAGCLLGVTDIVSRRPWVRRSARLDCFEGPVVPAGRDAREALSDIIKVAESAVGRGVISWHGLAASADPVSRDAFTGVLSARGYECTPWATSLVRLDVAEDELFARCTKAARKAIRRAAQHELKVHRCVTRDEYVDLYLGGYNSANPDRPEPLREAPVWDLDDGGHYHFYVVLDEDDAVHATLGTYRFNGMATEIGSARTPVGREAGLPAQDLLHWEVLRTHQSLGDHLFNVAGYEPEPADAKSQGIKRFKQKWGGDEVRYGRFSRRLPV